MNAPDYRPPDYLVPCDFCGKTHALKEERWECLNCGRVVCRHFANEGKAWHRRGEFLHLLQIPGHAENPPYVKVCGTLRRVANYEAPPAEPVAAGDATEGQTEPSIEPGRDAPETAVASPGAGA